MKFLVLGCNGMAGHMISLYLQERGHMVTGFAREESLLVPSIKGDAMDADNMRRIIGLDQYDSIINCIGLLNQFADSNKAEAVYINSYLPHYLAELTSGTETQVIHMSTDCVFSGKKGQYTEDDIRDGSTFYDRSKAMGELEDGKNITLRNSIVGPDINPKGIGLLNWFLQSKGTVDGYIHAMWTGQTTLQLAKTMEVAAQQRAHGLYNMVPDQSISKYDLLRLFNHYMRDNTYLVNPVDRNVLDKSLKRIRFDFSYIIPGYEEMISELAVWMKQHHYLYPHYHL